MVFKNIFLQTTQVHLFGSFVASKLFQQIPPGQYLHLCIYTFVSPLAVYVYIHVYICVYVYLCVSLYTCICKLCIYILNYVYIIIDVDIWNFELIVISPILHYGFTEFSLIYNTLFRQWETSKSYTIYSRICQSINKNFLPPFSRLASILIQYWSLNF